MHKFYFNDCLPSCNNQHEFINCLEKTLIEFNQLTKEDLNIEKAIVTEKLPSTLSLGNTYTLEDTISKIQDGSLKRLAFSYFQKYPIDAYFSLEDTVVERLLTRDYCLPINKYNHVALNLAMVREKSGFIFTVALHDDLKKHSFCLKPQIEAPDLAVDNLFGDADNTQIIRAKITDLNAVNLSNEEKLKSVLGDYVFSPNFEKEFSRLNDEEQISIIGDFEKAKNRGLLSPFYPDTKIIKDVTPDNKAKCNVYELRVYRPTALRVYFNESNDKVYVSNIGIKSSTDQNADIKKAHSTLNKLILTT